MLLFPHVGRALTLEEGLKIVAETGRDIKIARSDEEVARNSVSLARSPWLPQVNVYGNETWLRYQPMARFNTVIAPTAQDQFFTYGVTANQLLYDFGKTSSSIDAAKYDLKAREIATQRARNRSALDFILAYYDLLEADAFRLPPRRLSSTKSINGMPNCGTAPVWLRRMRCSRQM
jgi:outer membrane protein TolC